MRSISERLLRRAVEALQAGELVAYPTDTLIGIGALATDGRAVNKLFELKHRPKGTPVSVMVSSTEEVEEYARLSVTSRMWLRRLLPGQYTVLLDSSRYARKNLAAGCLASDGVIGIRIPDHPLSRELARRAGPMTSSSANIHGEPSGLTLRAVRSTFGRGITVYLPLVPPGSGLASQVVTLRRREPWIIERF